MEKKRKRKHCIEIQLEFILYYITLTDYYILNDTFRSQVITALLIWKEKSNFVIKTKTLN